MAETDHKARIRAIRAAGGLVSVDDLLTVSFAALKRAAGGRWRSRQDVWAKKIEEIAASNVGPDDVAMIDQDRVTLVFHPNSIINRDVAVIQIIKEIRDFFLGEPEIDLSSEDGFAWKSPAQPEAQEGESPGRQDRQHAKATAESEHRTGAAGPTASTREADAGPEESGSETQDETLTTDQIVSGFDFGEDWRPSYTATWKRHTLLDRRRLQHCLILPTIENELGGFDTSDAYFQSNETLVDLDLVAVRAAGAAAMKLYKKRDAGQVFFTLNVETLRVSSFRERLWRDVRQIPKPLLNKLCPILVRVSPKLPAASTAEAIAHLRSFIPTVYLAAAEARQIAEGGPYFPVEGYFFAPPPQEPGAWRRFGRKDGVLGLVKEHRKRAGVLAPQPRHECAEAIANGFDLAPLR